MSQDHPEEGKGKITIPWKWREEEGEDVIDLNDPNVQEILSKKWNQAHGYEKGQQELKAVKNDLKEKETQLNYWSGLVDDAVQSGDPSRVQAALESVGVKFTKAQSDDDDFVMDTADKKLESMKQEFEKKINQLEGALYNKYTEDAHSQLEAKYSNGKYPEYNRKEVEDFANKRGIRDFEDAYRVMNYDELVKVEKQMGEDKSKKHKDKIKIVAQDEPGSGGLPQPKPEKHTDYNKTWADIKKNPAIMENLFTDE